MFVFVGNVVTVVTVEVTEKNHHLSPKKNGIHAGFQVSVTVVTVEFKNN